MSHNRMVRKGDDRYLVTPYSVHMSTELPDRTSVLSFSNEISCVITSY